MSIPASRGQTCPAYYDPRDTDREAHAARRHSGHKKIVLLEKRAPLIIEEYAVGLKRVPHDLISSAVLFHQFHGFPEEVEFHESRFSTLPCDRNFRCAMRFKQLLDVSFQRSL